MHRSAASKTLWTGLLCLCLLQQSRALNFWLAAMQGKLSGSEMLSLATSGSEEQAAALMGSLSPEVSMHHEPLRLQLQLLAQTIRISLL